jgi:bacterioferritin-associated ferredoxin
MIDRCVCYDRTFAELKRIATREGAKTVEELQHHVEFGLNCRLCHRYVREMLTAGKTEFDFLDSSSVES